MNDLPLPKPSSNRSKRMRKKLRIEEFQLVGLRVEFHFDPQIDSIQTDELVFAFFDFFQTLGLGGCGISSKSKTTQYLLRYKWGSENPISVTDDDHARIERWLDEQSLVSFYAIDRQDATYDEQW